jgi:hypothetical protein
MRILNGKLQSNQFKASIFNAATTLSPSQLLRKMPEESLSLFVDEPLILPEMTGPGMPEIPRLIWQTKSSGWGLQWSPNRTDFVWQWRESHEGIVLSDFVLRASGFFKVMRNLFALRIERMALIGIWHAPNESPATVLANKFCKQEWIDGPLKQLEAFELHAHAKRTIGDFEVNCWVRNRSAALIEGMKPIVVCEQDINTLSEQMADRDFNDEQVASFLGLASDSMQGSLDSYFSELK